MKKQQHYLNSLNITEVAALTSIVKEVVSVECKPAEKRIFGVPDLWNIQKQRISFVQRRFAQ